MSAESLDRPVERGITQDALVLVERIEPHVVLVTLNRPQVCNAVNDALARQMLVLVNRIEADPGIRVAILTGAGEQAFCAGADVNELVHNSCHNIAEGPAGFAGFVEVSRSKPWIAAVRGHALGGGLELAMACEMIVAGESASFGLPEVKMGLIPGAGGLYRLPRRIPRAFANELVLTGAPVSARRAEQLGLVNHVVPDADVLTAARGLARLIAGNAPRAIQEAMHLLRKSTLPDQEPELARETLRAIGRLMHAPDFREGPRAFLERRPPDWAAAGH